MSRHASMYDRGYDDHHFIDVIEPNEFVAREVYEDLDAINQSIDLCWRLAATQLFKRSHSFGIG